MWVANLKVTLSHGIYLKNNPKLCKVTFFECVPVRSILFGTLNQLLVLSYLQNIPDEGWMLIAQATYGTARGQ